MLASNAFTSRALARMPLRDAVGIELVGHQWWWEARYRDADAARDFTTANELTIPVGRPVVVTLRADDVIHTLWVPSLAGKKDMIPGRTATLSRRVDRARECVVAALRRAVDAACAGLLPAGAGRQRHARAAAHELPRDRAAGDRPAVDGLAGRVFEDAAEDGADHGRRPRATAANSSPATVARAATGSTHRPRGQPRRSAPRRDPCARLYCGRPAARCGQPDRVDSASAP